MMHECWLPELEYFRTTKILGRFMKMRCMIFSERTL